ncbi:MAG TPA: DMT family transporter [Planctomycetota bacterium]|nr:DMT family transporter [Planctomycetota bacterium]
MADAPADKPAEADATSLHALRPPKRPSGLLSLFLTGMADVWSATRQGVARRGDLGGLLFMVASAASFALMAAFVKLYLPTVPTARTVFWRGALMTLAFVALARARRVPVAGVRRARLVLRGLLGAGAVSCYFWSVQRQSIGDAVLLQYTHPVFVAVLAPLVLRERTGRGHWLWVALAFAGVWLVAGAEGRFKQAALVGLSGSFLSGLAYMTVRDLSRTENPWTILTWFSATMAPTAAVWALVQGESLVPVDAAEVGGHLAMTSAGLVGQWALTHGLSRSGAARATAVSMSGPVFGLLLDLALPDAVVVADLSTARLGGTALVVGALICLALNRPKG